MVGKKGNFELKKYTVSGLNANLTNGTCLACPQASSASGSSSLDEFHGYLSKSSSF